MYGDWGLQDPAITYAMETGYGPGEYFEPRLCCVCGKETDGEIFIENFFGRKDYFCEKCFNDEEEE